MEVGGEMIRSRATNSKTNESYREQIEAAQTTMKRVENSGDKRFKRFQDNETPGDSKDKVYLLGELQALRDVMLSQKQDKG